MLSDACHYRPGWRLRRLWPVLLVSAFGLESTSALRAQTCDVALVLTPSELYEQATTPIRDLLTREGRKCEIVRFTPDRSETASAEAPSQDAAGSQPTPGNAKSETEQAADRLAQLKPKVIVSVGTAATSLALKALPSTPVVFCMVPNFADRQFAEEGRLDRLAGVTTDIAPAAQVDWIKRLSPGVKNLGLLHGERTRKTVDAIAREARTHNVNPLQIPTKLDQFPAAIAELDSKGCDGVLMVADSEVYNAASVQRLLVWGVRNRKPVWAFSPNLVKAGAFAAVYSDAEPMSRQVCAMVKKILAGENPKKLGIQNPDRVLSAANERTAELIGVPLPKDVLDTLDVRFGQKK